MKMSDEQTISAPRRIVWKALNDPAVLKQSIPGCESIIKHSDTKLEVLVMVKLGPVKARFSGIVNLTDLDPPNGYRISGEGKGGLAGFATGGATIKLEEVPEGTRMIYDVDARVGGKLAMLGSRLIDSTARSLAAQFFAKFGAIVGAMKDEAPPVKKPAKKAVKKAAKKAAKKAVKKKPAAKKR